MLAANDQNGFLPCERARWVTGGNVYFDTLKQLIQEAEKSLSVYFYIIANDTTGNQILELLRQAARRGVEVRLLIDDFASDEIDQEIEQSLVASGIHFHRFEPLFSTSNTYIGRRMHAKVVIADGVKALVAGINVADRYHGTATEKPWLDYGIYIEGPSSQVLEKWGATLSQPFLNIRHPKWSLFPHEDQYPDPKSIWTRVTVNDFAKNRKEITRSYNNALRKAEKSVTIVGGYFLPGRKFRRLLRQAAARGVSVNVIVTGISDVPITRLAAEYLYGRLLRSGIRIFEYQGAMLHGKAAVIDQTWLTIGSYNQNPLSAFLSIEVNVDVVNSALASDFHSHLDHIIQNESQEVTLEGYHLKSGWWVRLKRWVAYRLVKWSLRLLFLASKVETDDD